MTERKATNITWHEGLTRDQRRDALGGHGCTV